MHRCASPVDLVFTCRWVFAQMLRRGQKDPYSDTQLDGKTGVISQCQWQFRYVSQILRDSASLLLRPVSAGSAEGPASSKPNLWEQAKQCVMDPLLLYTMLEGPRRMATWLQSLPTEPLRLLVLHVQELFSNYYSPELKGALNQYATPAAYTWEKFQAAERVKARFTTDFEAASKKLRQLAASVGDPTGLADSADQQSDTAGSAAKEAPVQPPATQPDGGEKGRFRSEVEARVQQDLAARMVCLTKDGGHGGSCGVSLPQSCTRTWSPRVVASWVSTIPRTQGSVTFMRGSC